MGHPVYIYIYIQKERKILLYFINYAEIGKYNKLFLCHIITLYYYLSQIFAYLSNAIFIFVNNLIHNINYVINSHLQNNRPFDDYNQI